MAGVIVLQNLVVYSVVSIGNWRAKSRPLCGLVRSLDATSSFFGVYTGIYEHSPFDLRPW